MKIIKENKKPSVREKWNKLKARENTVAEHTASNVLKTGLYKNL